VEIGSTLSSEEQSPKDLVHLARAAEESGFSFATISDHFHPWTSQQGNSPFVWSVLGRSLVSPAGSALALPSRAH
jgi:coenzyme F420-dependent glucose-6-phosphate dehydrogenase